VPALSAGPFYPAARLAACTNNATDTRILDQFGGGPPSPAGAAYSPFARFGFLKVTKHTPAIATAEQAKANQDMEPGMAGAPDFAAKAQLRGPASRLARPARTEIGNVFILVMTWIILIVELKAIIIISSR
jgi:hypothetical protein